MQIICACVRQASSSARDYLGGVLGSEDVKRNIDLEVEVGAHGLEIRDLCVVLCRREVSLHERRELNERLLALVVQSADQLHVQVL